jgi:mRNA interferase YafQ
MRIIPSKRFERNFDRVHDNRLRESITKTLEKLEINPFDPVLRTHKLKGRLSGVWACKVTSDYRILFEITEDDAGTCILLLSVGKHDEVY